MADWALIFRDQEADPRPSIKETAEAIDAVLRTRPQADQEILAIIGKRLGTEIGPKTWEILDNAVSYYVGGDALSLVLWVVLADEPDRIAKVTEVASPGVAALVRAIAGMYGAELKLAFQRWNELPDDWVGVNREIYHDVINDRMIVKMRIDKNSGQPVIIEGPSSSFLELTANMLRTCRLVGRPGVFTQRTIDMLLEEFEEFHKLVGISADVESATALRERS
jgi:hypothetical protein